MSLTLFSYLYPSLCMCVCDAHPCVCVCQDSKISSMERGLRDLEEEVMVLKSNGALSTEEREEEMKQMEVYRSHSKFMKNKVTHTPAASHTHTHTQSCIEKVLCYSFCSG